MAGLSAQVGLWLFVVLIMYLVVVVVVVVVLVVVVMTWFHYTRIDRLFTVMTLTSEVELQFEGVNTIHSLYRKPALSAWDLFCAPQEQWLVSG